VSLEAHKKGFRMFAQGRLGLVAGGRRVAEGGRAKFWTEGRLDLDFYCLYVSDYVPMIPLSSDMIAY
jgi:hypothetical protein